MKRTDPNNTKQGDVKKQKKTAVKKLARCETPRLPEPEEKRFKIVSWNVNGLRAILKSKRPQLEGLVKEEMPDLLCIQETKLQEKDVEALGTILPGFTAHWSCSTDKKGYAGTVVFTKCASPKKADTVSKKQTAISSFFKKAPKKEEKASGLAAATNPLPVLDVTYGIGAGLDGSDSFDNAAWNCQGRAITVEYEAFFVVALYVLNSGQKLEQLKVRVNEWDPALRQYLQQLAAKKQVIVTGDLNVAHADADIWNPEAKHLAKQAGCTKAEKESFTKLLEEGPVKFVDSFRQQNPSATGVYSYWSTRANGRPVNHGIRLDYFVCSEGMFQGCDGNESDMGRSAAVRAHDSYVLDEATVGASDHAPVGLVLRLV
jgi:exodeoxyribonuclease III